METVTIARAYASALHEIAGREGESESYADAFDEVIRLLDGDPRIRPFIEAPTIAAEEKLEVLRRALEGQVPTKLLGFLMVVVGKRRQRLLREMAEEYHRILDQELGRVHARITMAREPDEGVEREIAGDLSRRLGREVVPHVRVDPSIIGGVIVRYQDHVLDASVRRRLILLRRRLMEAIAEGGAAGPAPETERPTPLMERDDGEH